MSGATLQRTAFVTSRSLEFFSEAELTTQLSYGRTLWPLIIAKELIDNVLDAVESIDAAPVVDITLEPNALIVADNGPGIPAEVIDKSLDYQIRISDKKNYVSPTRGQLGNALKCIWAAPFVATGEKSHAVVIGRGVRHEIHVSLDRIQQRPDIKLTTQKLRSVKNGSSVRIEWSGIASSKVDDEDADFYRDGSLPAQLMDLVLNFAAFNPHATFRLKLPGVKFAAIKPSDPSWLKWRTSDPTSPHWYRAEDLRALIAAYISSDEHKTLRDFVREFAGLSGTQIAKRVLHDAKLTALGLADLVRHGDIDMRLVVRLLDAMKACSHPVQPKRLGIIGLGHFTQHALAAGVAQHTFRYKKMLGFDAGGLPFTLEVGFGLKKEDGRRLVCGLNNSVVFKIPTDDLSDAMSEARIEWSDPVVLYVHVCSPRFEFLDHRKGSFVSGTKMGSALAKAIELTTREFTKAKRRAAAAKRDRLTAEQIRSLRVKEEKKEIKAAAYQVMERAYNLASDDGRLPARPRQIMYAARPLVLEITGGKCWKNSAYFTQTLLPDYREEHPEQTLTWNVVYDARGHFREPHTGITFEIGTLEVREYRAAWRSGSASTYGPTNRFRHALFIEKEGFDALIKESGILERFDVSYFSTKGVSVTACRELVDELSKAGVTTLVAHDFDFSGFTIMHTLGHDTRRYGFDTAPQVIDLGLRLADVREMNLDPEPVELAQDKDPRIRLREYGARSDEIEFLVRDKAGYGKFAHWNGQRVELNALTSRQFIEWLERKLIEHGVGKVVPEIDLLGEVWQGTWKEPHREAAYDKFEDPRKEDIRKLEAQIAEIQGQIDQDFEKQYNPPETPPDLQERIREYLRTEPSAPWDAAVAHIEPTKD